MKVCKSMKLVGILLLPLSLSAADVTWRKGADGKWNGDWSDKTRWSTGELPTAADRVVFPRDMGNVATITVNGTYEIGSLDVAADTGAAGIRYDVTLKGSGRITLAGKDGSGFSTWVRERRSLTLDGVSMVDTGWQDLMIRGRITVKNGALLRNTRFAKLVHSDSECIIAGGRFEFSEFQYNGTEGTSDTCPMRLVLNAGSIAGGHLYPCGATKPFSLEIKGGTMTVRSRFDLQIGGSALTIGGGAFKMKEGRFRIGAGTSLVMTDGALQFPDANSVAAEANVSLIGGVLTLGAVTEDPRFNGVGGVTLKYDLASVDFGTETGRIRPALHSSGFGPTVCSQTAQDLEDVKAMGFAYARTHDWALINPNQRVCDYFHIFPLMHLDAKDPKNYVFGPTDYLLKRTREEAGLDVFYRMGTSIEHSGYRTHFNSLIPEDFDKMAEVFAGIVRHYNRGWADGYRWGIRYWEIWNEPEGIENMWCPKEGVAGLSEAESGKEREACRKLFVKFFVTVLKRLKDEFGDEIKVGGPALCGYNTVWLNEILKACKEANVAPDFISWHGYTNDPMRFNIQSEEGRALLDGYGFTACEMIVNEWHYFGLGEYDFTDLRCSDPKVRARVWTGPRSHNGIHGACFTLATLANLQRSKLSQAYYYGCSHTGSWGFKDAMQAKYKVFHALRLFGDLVKRYPVLCASTGKGAYTTLAVKSADGRDKALLVVDYGGKDRRIALAVKGASAVKACTVLDYTRDLTPCAAELADGRLTLTKADDNSAAFWVRFEE